MKFEGLGFGRAFVNPFVVKPLSYQRHPEGIASCSRRETTATRFVLGKNPMYFTYLRFLVLLPLVMAISLAGRLNSLLCRSVSTHGCWSYIASQMQQSLQPNIPKGPKCPRIYQKKPCFEAGRPYTTCRLLRTLLTWSTMFFLQIHIHCWTQ